MRGATGATGLRRALALVVCVAAGALCFFWLYPRAGSRRAPPAARPVPPMAARASGGAIDGPSRIFQVEDRKGELALEGIVVDAGDRPVDEAVVTLDTAPPRELTTAADGIFSFRELGPGRVRVVARRGSQVAGPVEVVVDARTESQVLRLADAPVLHVAVASADGRPIAGADVELRGLAVARGSTDARGAIDLPTEGAGVYALTATASGFGRAYEKVEVPGGAREHSARLVLLPGQTVTGRVVDAEGAPVARVAVWAEPSSSPSWLSRSAVGDGGTTDERGRFVLHAVALGSYRVLARHPDFAPGASAIFTVTGGRAIEDLVVVLRPGARLAGHVVDTRGAPVAGAVVNVATRDADSAADPTWEASTGADGAFAVTGLPRRVVVAAASAPGACSGRAEIDLGAAPARTDLVLRLEHALGIAGVVVTPAGDPVAEARVTAIRDYREVDFRDLRLRPPVATTSGADGRFEVSGLEPGTYGVHVDPVESARRASFFSEPAAHVPAGTRGLRIVVETPATVSGKVAFQDGTPPALFRVGTGNVAAASFGARAGEFQLSDIVPGRVSLVVSGPEFAQKLVPDVSVVSGRDTDVGTITVEKGRTISGRVLLPDGSPVAGAAVYAGKRLVATGNELTSRVWGAPGSSGATRRTETDETGSFSLPGFGGDALALAAETSAARSDIVQVPPGTGPFSVDLVLRPGASIRGVVMRGGAPAPGMNVNASPVPGNNHSNFTVTTGPDGRFELQRMPAGDYYVSVMFGLSPLVGISQAGVAAHVDETAGAEVRIDLASATGTIVVAAVDPTGAGMPMVEVHTFAGRFTAHLAGELHARADSVRSGSYAFNIALGGNPARVKELPLGQPYTVCAVPYPLAVTHWETAEILAFVAEHGATLPAFCASVELTHPGDTPLAIPARLPDMPGEPVR
ncbi:MAG TPA: carboxypeptidase regulatory-like domain-containing protein [Kofleriaceae bacterium]|nr:carboxypeptidase regulatory-like domain-containing protein [Kofleriaceae bacterium]